MDNKLGTARHIEDTMTGTRNEFGEIVILIRIFFGSTLETSLAVSEHDWSLSVGRRIITNELGNFLALIEKYPRDRIRAQILLFLTVLWSSFQGQLGSEIPT